jgi:hypothetical protein
MLDIKEKDIEMVGNIKADWPDAVAMYLAEKDGKFELTSVKLPELQIWPEYEEVIKDQHMLKQMIENYTGDKVADDHIDVFARPRMN